MIFLASQVAAKLHFLRRPTSMELPWKVQLGGYMCNLCATCVQLRCNAESQRCVAQLVSYRKYYPAPPGSILFGEISGIIFPGIFNEYFVPFNLN